jgi:hypothetical protein
MIRETGTSTLGFLVWTFAVAMAGWMALVATKYFELRAQKEAHALHAAFSQSAVGGLVSVLSVAALTIVVWGLFCIITVYKDHLDLVAQNQLLRSELTRRNTKGLSLRIGGFVLMEVNNSSTRVQLTVVATNDGDSTNVKDWKLIAHTSSGVLTSYHAFGDQLAKESLDVSRLDARLQGPIEDGAQIPGLVSFVFPHVQKKTFEDLRDDKSATLLLSVTNRFGKEISTERNIAEMAAERYQHIPK